MKTEEHNSAEKIVQLWHGLAPDTRLVRYMRLSAFLSLISGRQFFPSLKVLQGSSDPTEGQLTSTHFSFVRALAAFASRPDLAPWLHPSEIASIQAIHSAALNAPCPDLETVQRRLEERLAETRAILCFHGKPEEDMAMWQIYARDGVAIETTPHQLDAFAFPANSFPHLAEVRYRDVGQFGDEEPISLIARPYLFKLSCYGFEKEIRLAFVTEPTGSGVTIQVNARKLIKSVRFSPFMHADEAKVIGDLCRPFLDTHDIEQSTNRAIPPWSRYGVPFSGGDLHKMK